MPTYTSALRFLKPNDLEYTGTWMNEFSNSVVALIDEAIAGRALITSMPGNLLTLSTNNGATDQARCAILTIQNATLAAAGTITIPAVAKMYIVENKDAYQVTVKTAAGAGIVVPTNTVMFVYCNALDMFTMTYLESLTLTTQLALTYGGTGATSVAGAQAALSLLTLSAATGSLKGASGTTAQRPAGINGYFRYNTDLAVLEVYNAVTSWATALQGLIVDSVIELPDNDGTLAYGLAEQYFGGYVALGTGTWSTHSGWGLTTGRQVLAGCGTQSAALSFGGSGYAIAEKFDGIAWGTGNFNLSASRYNLAGCGTQSAALGFGGSTGTVSAVTESFNGASWSTTGSLNTARYSLGGCGTQSAALSFGGFTTVDSAVTEKFDGSTWTNTGGLNTARSYLAGCGTQSAALNFGGYTGAYSAVTEKFDGSAWSTNAGWNLGTARYGLAGCGTQSAALSFGGYAGIESVVTEKFDGSTWSTNAGWNLGTARFGLAGCGTQSAALSFGGLSLGPVIHAVTEKFNASGVKMFLVDP